MREDGEGTLAGRQVHGPGDAAALDPSEREEAPALLEGRRVPVRLERAHEHLFRRGVVARAASTSARHRAAASGVQHPSTWTPRVSRTVVTRSASSSRPRRDERDHSTLRGPTDDTMVHVGSVSRQPCRVGVTRHTRPRSRGLGSGAGDGRDSNA